MDSKALTKLQSAALIVVILFATIGGSAIYLLWSQNPQSSEPIIIGICADIDNFTGEDIWQEAVLAVEHVNAEGGVLGRNLTVVAEDDDSESAIGDTAIATNAMTRLITVDKADFILTSGLRFSSVYQELAYQHKKIMFDGYALEDELTQKVLDDYDRYKYYFRVGIPNATSAEEGSADAIATCCEYTGFDKVAILFHDLGTGRDRFSGIADNLEEFNIEVVYTALIPLDIVDFSSYFAHAEAAGAEMIYAGIGGPAGTPFVEEYYNRQSPLVIWGVIGWGAQTDFWELTEGKCEYVSCNSYPTGVGYPLTNKTLAFRDAYLERWGEVGSGPFYDAIRFILPDAIRRAGTIETDAVIATLESVDVETSLARHFIFTSSHDIMIGEAGPNKPSEDYFLICIFQWQNGELVPVYPKEIMEEAGATYILPDWAGPWD